MTRTWHPQPLADDCRCETLSADFTHGADHARACPAHDPEHCPKCARAREQENA